MKNYLKNLITTAIAASFYLPVAVANAQEHNHTHDEEQMHDHGDNPLVTKVMFDRLEVREANDSGVIEAQAWVGKNLNKFWLKADAEKHEGETEDAELQALYSRAITPYWDVQMGLRQDIKPTPSHTWAVLGMHGLAPYFFEVDAALFIDDTGATALRISAEYELLFTQQLILSPEVEVNLYGQNDAQAGTGSGLSDIKTGLRLRYEIRREFAPYVGVDWSKKFGNTAAAAKNKGDVSGDSSLVAGIRIWF